MWQALPRLLIFMPPICHPRMRISINRYSVTTCVKNAIWKIYQQYKNASERATFLGFCRKKWQNSGLKKIKRINLILLSSKATIRRPSEHQNAEIIFCSKIKSDVCLLILWQRDERLGSGTAAASDSDGIV